MKRGGGWGVLMSVSTVCGVCVWVGVGVWGGGVGVWGGGERYFKFLSEYSPCLLESA